MRDPAADFASVPDYDIGVQDRSLTYFGLRINPHSREQSDAIADRRIAIHADMGADPHLPADRRRGMHDRRGVNADLGQGLGNLEQFQ